MSDITITKQDLIRARKAGYYWFDEDERDILAGYTYAQLRELSKNINVPVQTLANYAWVHKKTKKLPGEFPYRFLQKLASVKNDQKRLRLAIQCITQKWKYDKLSIEVEKTK